MSGRSLALTFVVLLAACATPNVEQDFRLNPASNEGVVAGSVTYSGRYSGYSVRYRHLPSGTSGKFETGQGVALIPYVPKGDFNDATLRGNVFAAALPAGDYEIFRWSVGSGAANVGPTVPFSIRFRVEPGKMVYLGNFHFTQTSSMGLTVTGATVTYRESIDRDLPIMKAKFPAFADVPIGYSIPRGTSQENVGGQFTTTITVPVFVPLRKP